MSQSAEPLNHVEARLHYGGRDGRRSMRIYDARPLADSLSLEVQGFALKRCNSAVSNFYDPGQVRSIYYPEVEQLVKEVTGATKVLAFEHDVRCAPKARLVGGKPCANRSRSSTTTILRSRRLNVYGSIFPTKPPYCSSRVTRSSTFGDQLAAWSRNLPWRFAMREVSEKMRSCRPRRVLNTKSTCSTSVLGINGFIFLAWTKMRRC
jgi:hypothetical protein